jgi:hypothetical protein
VWVSRRFNLSIGAREYKSEPFILLSKGYKPEGAQLWKRLFGNVKKGRLSCIHMGKEENKPTMFPLQELWMKHLIAL